MIKKKVFLASSAELREDRMEFELFICRKNKDWVDKGVFIELVVWEDFLDAVSQTRLQDEYNAAIRGCDLFVMLFFTKVGRYTTEEFETAFGQFKATNKPFIFTYFKDAPVDPAAVDAKDRATLDAFKKKLDRLGHYYTRYSNTDALKHHFNRQLDKLVETRFIAFKPDQADADAAAPSANQAHIIDNGAIAQGGGHAVAPGGVYANNSGDINTGTQINVGGSYVGGSVDVRGGDFIGRDRIARAATAPDRTALLAPLTETVAQHASADQKTHALGMVQALEAEIAKGSRADDPSLARIVDSLGEMVPEAGETIIRLFDTPGLTILGPVTEFVLDKLKRH